ncbi:hypothetical protein CL657_01495 [bacterium]|nr:hypothetical protein [bacterium]|tara:strand:+ start:219 stop:1205 length:987 start_codon:yes stop_codon:yes gene_type:complete
MLKILHISTPNVVYPLTGYGGAQRVSWDLAEGQFSQGKYVLMATPRGSSSSILPLVVIDKFKSLHRHSDKDLRRFYRLISETLPFSFDVIQGHGHGISHCLDFFPNTSLVTTIHGHQEPLPDKPVHGVFISNSQKKEYERYYKRSFDYPVIYNPIHFEQFSYDDQKEDYLIFMAKIDWDVKGIDVAIRVAEATRNKLYICGPGMTRAVKKKLSDYIVYKGEVFGKQKVDLLKKAKAILYPTQWPEPFGLAPVEANACGTPAIVFNNGAMPEVIQHGITGFICNTEADMIATVKKIPELSSQCIYESAYKRFNHLHISKQYYDYYESLM